MRDLIVENATILFPNFAGMEGRFNEAGSRNFCLIIDNDQVPDLKKDGWNIKYLKPRDNSTDPEQAYLPVAVRFEPYPPEITFISGRGRVILNERTVHELDSVEFDNIDLIVKPSQWTDNDGNRRVKAYLKEGFFVQRISPLAQKYRLNKEAEVDPVGECVCSDCPNPCGSQGECRDDVPF